MASLLAVDNRLTFLYCMDMLKHRFGLFLVWYHLSTFGKKRLSPASKLCIIQAIKLVVYTAKTWTLLATDVKLLEQFYT